MQVSVLAAVQVVVVVAVVLAVSEAAAVAPDYLSIFRRHIRTDQSRWRPLPAPIRPQLGQYLEGKTQPASSSTIRPSYRHPPAYLDLRP